MGRCDRGETQHQGGGEGPGQLELELKMKNCLKLRGHGLGVAVKSKAAPSCQVHVPDHDGGSYKCGKNFAEDLKSGGRGGGSLSTVGPGGGGTVPLVLSALGSPVH